jgi:hypothetical protein
MIDMDFLPKSYDVSNSVLFVHPSLWLLDEKNKQQKFINTKNKTQHTNQLEAFTIIVNSFFNIKISNKSLQKFYANELILK